MIFENIYIALNALFMYLIHFSYKIYSQVLNIYCEKMFK
jgi:hypothetical protein